MSSACLRVPGQAREKLFRAYTTRASSLSGGTAASVAEEAGAGAGDGTDSDSENGNNNEPLIERILELRKSMADLLGYGSYAECSIASKVPCLVHTLSRLLV